MQTYEWIVIGAGITGSALAYELVKTGCSVLLLDRPPYAQNATRLSYGGLAFWAGTTELTRQLCDEGMALHRSLPAELEADTQLRELDLLLTIAPDADIQATIQFYQQFAIPPQLLDVQAACELEPLLNPEAIAGALTVKHGHIVPEAMANAYLQAFKRLGGCFQLATVTGLQRQNNGRVTGVVCKQDIFQSNGTIVCAGALSRALLNAASIPVRLYFTHAEMIEIPATDFQLRTFVMPAETKRFSLEAKVSTSDLDHYWNEPGHELVPPILDTGAIQFLDGSCRIGQISRALTDPSATVDPQLSETAIRSQVGALLPAIKQLPGSWHHCLIAFSSDRLPLVGAIPAVAGVHLFSGFSVPLVIVPALARRFAAHLTGHEDEIVAQLSPDRFDR